MKEEETMKRYGMKRNEEIPETCKHCHYYANGMCELHAIVPHFDDEDAFPTAPTDTCDYFEMEFEEYEPDPDRAWEGRFDA